MILTHLTQVGSWEVRQTTKKDHPVPYAVLLRNTSKPETSKLIQVAASSELAHWIFDAVITTLENVTGSERQNLDVKPA